MSSLRAAGARAVKVLTRGRFVAALLVSLLLLLLASALFSLVVGPSELGLGSVLEILGDRDASGPGADIVWRIRLPRTQLAMLVGASLAVSGVIFQALLRNPLADPFVLGVSGGAALGGIAVLALGTSLGFGYEFVPPAAFAGALLATVLLYLAAGVRGRVSATSLLLTGVVFNAFASAAIVFLASLAGFAEGSRIFLWLIGNLAASRADVAPRGRALPRGGGGVSAACSRDPSTCSCSATSPPSSSVSRPSGTSEFY